MTAPFAEYELTSVPDFPEFECSMGVRSRHVLNPAQETYVSRRPSDTIFVKGSPTLYQLGWGGTRNHLVSFVGGQWLVHDLGSHSPVRVDGERLRATKPLTEGMRVEPATGLVFTFVLRGDLEALASDEHVAELAGPAASRPVLLDLLLERLGGDRASAERALLHFHYRLAHAGTL